jgi:hypothetical protein
MSSCFFVGIEYCLGLAILRGSKAHVTICLELPWFEFIRLCFSYLARPVLLAMKKAVPPKL